jgi:hypothetical protein
MVVFCSFIKSKNHAFQVFQYKKKCPKDQLSSKFTLIILSHLNCIYPQDILACRCLLRYKQVGENIPNIFTVHLIFEKSTQIP